MSNPFSVRNDATFLALPSFLIGRDADGRWLAVESHGLSGGIFASEAAAARFAALETDRRAGAVRLTDEPLALPFRIVPS